MVFFVSCMKRREEKRKTTFFFHFRKNAPIFVFSSQINRNHILMPLTHPPPPPPLLAIFSFLKNGYLLFTSQALAARL